VPAFAQHADLHLDGRQRLRRFVVQVAREAAAFRFVLPHHQTG